MLLLITPLNRRIDSSEVAGKAQNYFSTFLITTGPLKAAKTTNYKYHSHYSASMPTTIQLDEEVRDKIKSFGSKGETYNDIISRLYDVAVQQQLRELLFSSKDTLTLAQARTEHAKRWQK